MSQAPFTLSRDWTNPDQNNGGFATYLADEDTVRADMQCLFTELLNNINTLLSVLQRVGTADSGEGGANEIGIDAISGIPGATNVQEALKAILDSYESGTVTIDSVFTDAVRDGAITTPKLDGKAVTTLKLDDEAVTTPKIAPGAVTTDKTKFTGGLQIGQESESIDVGTGHFNVDAYGRMYLARTSSTIGYAFGSGDGFPNNANYIGRLYFKKVQT